MRSKRFLAVALAGAFSFAAMPAAGQTISYINLLQFDLTSYRSQATAGMHDDDIEKVANAARLLEVDGNRLYTNFANLNDPATLGDNLVTYSKDLSGNPSTSDLFDTGSFLGGWIGKYDDESDYVFSVFYQRNHNRSMFENLEDGSLGSGSGFGNDAEFEGTFTEAFDDGTGGNTADDLNPDRLQVETTNLQRYDDRSAVNFDLGAAKEVSSDLSVGGRLFWEQDQLDRFSEGRSGTVFSQKFIVDGPLLQTGRNETVYWGNGEEAYKQSEMGLSLDADYHAWSNQSFNVRLDLFGTNVTNPSSGISFPSRGAPTPFDPAGYTVNFSENTNYTTVTAGDGTAADNSQFNSNGDIAAGGLGYLSQNRENRTINASQYLGGSPIYSVDDERTGFGLAGLVEYDRAIAGGNSRTWGGYSRRPYDVDATIVEKDYSRTTFWWNAGSGDREAVRTNFEDTVTMKRSGDMTVSAWELGTRWNRRMNNNVAFGCGLILTRNTWNEDYEQTEIEESRTGFDDGDSGDNALYTANGSTNPAFNENSTVTTTTYVINVEHEVRTTTTRLPVGVTFRWGDAGKYGWNMGVTHNINNQTVETKFDQPSDAGGQSVTVVNDVAGALVNETTYSGDAEYGNGTLTDKERWNTTSYFYGFEWRPTDATQFNVNGFFDTHGDPGDDDAPFSSFRQISDVDFFRNLAVSLTFFFM